MNNDDDDEAFIRQRNLLVRRGVECGLQLLARLSHYRVYLTAEERSKHRTPSGDRREPQKPTIYDAMDASSRNGENSSNGSSTSQEMKPTTFEETHFLTLESWVPAFLKKDSKKSHLKGKDRRVSDSSEQSGIGADMNNCIDLELHMSLSCGNVTNIILGDLDPNESFNFQHPSLYPQVRSTVENATNFNTVLDEFFMEYHGRLEYAIGGDVVDSLDEGLSLAKAGEMSISPSAYDIVQRQGMNLTFERRRRFFIIKNILEDNTVRKTNNLHTSPLRPYNVAASRKSNAVVQTNADFLKTLPGLRSNASKMTFEPLVPRVRNTGHMNLPVESNRYYFKYISRSALYRMQHSVAGIPPAQFREVTIMFISLGKTDVAKRNGLIKVQKAVLLALQALVKYEGNLQQFAIDDKGKALQLLLTAYANCKVRCHFIIRVWFTASLS
jgi:hypothetical protein